MEEGPGQFAHHGNRLPHCDRRPRGETDMIHDGNESEGGRSSMTARRAVC